MIKLIRILEVPLLILVIAVGGIEQGLLAMPLFLIFISVLRLVINVMTEEAS
tara:strand:+ start:367 stop:522 length:156 start_codon:yes stop_codon:yes gene_type:complete